MRPIQSVLENRTFDLDSMKRHLEQFQFILGGNWDYDHGSFDRSLDGVNNVWLRLPFEVTKGKLTGEDSESPGAEIRMGQPYVLKHIYQEGPESSAEANTVGGLVNQFQSPQDADAQVEEHWVREAMNLLTDIERGLA